MLHMKKVRFETPEKPILCKMEESECHSPRPFTERQIHTNVPDIYNYSKILPFSNDPIQLFDSSNSSPYPVMHKTKLITAEQGPLWSPCSELEISIFDGAEYDSRPLPAYGTLPKVSENQNKCDVMNTARNITQNKVSVLAPIENRIIKPPNMLVKDDDFFIKRDNLNKIHIDLNPTQHQFNKENNPQVKEAQKIRIMGLSDLKNDSTPDLISRDCRCHHCVKVISKTDTNKEVILHPYLNNSSPHYMSYETLERNQCKCCVPPPVISCPCCNNLSHPQQNFHQTCGQERFCNMKMDAIQKKTLAIEKYEQSKKSDAMEVDKQTNVIREKREPTVTDLFKIIKLQNEQLQLLQEKVDKFISAKQQNNDVPVQNCISEHVTIETVENEQHKISIGVMTSFEMVRTSTIVNKEVVKTCENAQVQCNRSQISIKEVVSKSQPPNSNFLDGIPNVRKPISENIQNEDVGNKDMQHANDEKTLNELSLYNVQIDNAITPLMSPEQSLYLDVRDYSDSEAESDDQSNVGWTYYNKVMTHVNGVLQDSDMPSSASAMYRNMRQQTQTVQMQIDKTNVSVTKRVKFGDDPLGVHQPHIYAASSDTSLKMNQLAAKYLTGVSSVPVQKLPTAAPTDMSLATKKYMERHKILQSVPASPKPHIPPEMPRFLDITALKQQPKFL